MTNAQMKLFWWGVAMLVVYFVLGQAWAIIPAFMFGWYIFPALRSERGKA